MSATNSIEQTAATVEEAIRQALEQLGAYEDDVTIEVLSTPRVGVLGLGARQARVRVTRLPPEAARSPVQSPPPAPPRQGGAARSRGEREPAPAPRGLAPRASDSGTEPAAAAPASDTRRTADRDHQTREAIAIAGRILELMDEQGEVRTGQGEGDSDSIELEVKGDGSGVLIGRHGQTLDALEYLVNRILTRRLKDALPVVIDTESYRARRRQQIHRMALSMGEQAKREHETVKLEPMPPRDRRIVHLALKDDPLITTRSAGEGFLRSIEIIPSGPAPPRGGRERKRGREREGAIGEQGGFKHGQKKIV